MLILQGRVSSGFGVAGEHLAPIAGLIRQRTGLRTLVPGTLNLRLGLPYRFHPDAEITHEEYGYERLKLQRCCVQGHRAVILRPETHESGNGHGDAHIELLAEVHLRSALGLHDDDILDVTVGHDLPCWAPALHRADISR
jgi:CTP-dependent riboflavin kinase